MTVQELMEQHRKGLVTPAASEVKGVSLLKQLLCRQGPGLHAVGAGPAYQDSGNGC